MSDQQAKKLSLALYLNPVISEADRVAMGALQQWFEKTRNSYGDQPGDNLDLQVRAFHRDIYLAGLHLQLINPRLCRLVAEAIAEGEYSAETLESQLAACGLRTPGPAAGETSSFSATQLEQLEQLLASRPLPPAEPSAPSEQAVSQPSEVNSVLTEQFAEQKVQLTAMMAELQQLRALAEQQAKRLQELGAGIQPAPAPEPAARSESAEETDVSGMTSQIAQMQKIRKKGVF